MEHRACETHINTTSVVSVSTCTTITCFGKFLAKFGCAVLVLLGQHKAGLVQHFIFRKLEIGTLLATVTDECGLHSEFNLLSKNQFISGVFTKK